MLAEPANTPANKQATGMLNGKTHPPLKERVSKLTTLSATYPAGGQVLEKRYRLNVNFGTGSAAAPATASATKSRKKSTSSKCFYSHLRRADLNDSLSLFICLA